MSEESRLLDAESVSLRLGVSTRTLRRLVDSGRAPKPTKLGGLLRWPSRVIGDWIDSGCQSAN